MRVLQCLLALPFFVLGLPAALGIAAVATQAFSSMTCSRPLFGWGIDALLILVGIPFVPFLLLGFWIWPEDDDFKWIPTVEAWLDRRLAKKESTQI